VNITEASTVLALLRHLDGSRVRDERVLRDDLVILAGRAGKALQFTVTLDEDVLLDTLTAVALFVDEDDDAEEDEPPRRPVENVPVAGDRL